MTLKEYRIEFLALGLREAARKIKMSATSLTRIEQGNDCSITSLIRIADGSKVTLDAVVRCWKVAHAALPETEGDR